MVELRIPNNEKRISELGEAAQARAIPCLRFFLTREARPLLLRELVSILYKLGERWIGKTGTLRFLLF